MNSFLKYIIYFLLGLMITFLLKDKLIEGYGENGFQLLARIIGQNEQGDSRTQYSGCQIYECDNKHNYDNLELKNLEELKDILKNKLNETRLSESEIDGYSLINKNNLIREIKKINKANYYVDKEYSNDLNYLICNNEMGYSPASLLGDNRCNHEKCCFNTKCSSEDVMNLDISCHPGVLNKEANCFNLEGCKENFQNLCCTKDISEISEHVKEEFYKIYKIYNPIYVETNASSSVIDNFPFDDRKISLSKIKDYYSLTESDILDNILSIKPVENEDIELDIYDFDYLFTK